MRKFLAVTFVCFLVCIYSFSFNDNKFFYYIETIDNNYKVVENDCDYKVISIDCDYIEKVKDVFDLVVLNSEKVSGRLIIDGYSNKLKKHIVVDDLKINMQISISDNECVVGYPVIKNSF